MNFCSFRNVWGSGYGGDYIENNTGTSRNKILEAVHTLKDEAVKLNGFSLSNLDYRQVQITEPGVIYLDPPYRNTNGYKGGTGESFDHTEFYKYVVELSKTHFVLISEYFMPKPFKAIKWIDKPHDIGSTTNAGCIEGLFVVDGGYGVQEVLDFITMKDIDISQLI